MLRRRLLFAGRFLVLTLTMWLVVACTSKSQPVGGGSAPSVAPISATLPKENVEVLQKLNSQADAEKLQAIAPVLRDNAEMKASLRSSGVMVQVLPETLRIYDLYATVEAQLSGKNTEHVTYILQPSDGQWLIASLKKG